MKRLLPLFLTLLLMSACSVEKLYMMRHAGKSQRFEQVGFEDVVKKYLSKAAEPGSSVEGIYAVSSLVVKKGKRWFTGETREKVLERKDNFTQVAVIADHENGVRDFIEIPLDKRFLPTYSVVGEFSKLTEGNILMYKNFKSRKGIESYTFTFDTAADLLEGVRTETRNAGTSTYTLSYVKVFPKRYATEVASK